MATPNLGLKNDHAASGPLSYAWANSVADDLDAAHAAIPSATITPGAEAGNVIQVTVQIVNLAGNNIAEKRAVDAWLVDSNDAAAALCASAPSGGWVAGVGRLLESSTAGKKATWITNSSGVVRIDITHSGTATYYLVVRIGSKLVIGAVAFA